MDTKFSVAVHILILISESPTHINSEQMAQSVGTNASYIRKILSLLKRAAIIDGLRGIYAAGVLDYCMEHDIRFDLGIGVSAGSANLASYAAGQIGRNYKIYTEYDSEGSIWASGTSSLSIPL